jgi:cytochrome c oxidase subunit 2
MPPTYPALKGSAIAKGPLPNHLNRVLNGKPGTAMQAFRDQFSDSDLAAVITYERNAWGNNTGDAVQPAQVTAAKALPPLQES